MLAETGKNLSGGQQQRLAIARALVKNAPILILDEATSALDALSENRIKAAIKDLHGQVTQIIIAHRLATIEHADRIIYLEKGEKIAEGTRDELLSTCTPFRQMWEALYRTNASMIEI
jgi:ABC-type multidrug transport system fused ATPase/permease subunit